VEIALEEKTPRALDRALYELYRVGPRTPPIERLAGLVRAALALGHRTERAFDAANELEPFADLALERRRQGLRATAVRLRPQADQEALLDELGVWADQTGDPEARAAFAGWIGQLRYRQGRFAEGAALHAEAAEGERWVTARLSALLRSASARMEAFQFEEAGAVATLAKDAAERHRLPFYQAHAEWIVRSVAYRTGAAAAPDLALVDAAAQLRMGDIEAMVALNEAAIAFRAGARDVAVDLALRARQTWSSLGETSGGALLAASLALAGGGDSADDEVRSLSSRALSCPVPGVGIQVLGLLAMAGRAPDVDADHLGALAGQVAGEAWDQRLDVLSIREARELLSRRSSLP
jgi:eukaryotic-like serine/threonine-protein kinase